MPRRSKSALLPWLWLLLWVVPALAAAQDLQALQRQPGVPEAMGQDLQTLSGYYGQVARRAGAPAASERDPFQVTPDLRRRPRDPAGQPLAASVPGDDWRLQGLLLGAEPLAVLVRGAAADAPRGAPPARRIVRVGESLDMPDGRSWQVIAIDRQGVLVRGDGVELDTLRIR